MAKRKLSDEPDMKFVHESDLSEVTKTICVEIKNFTAKIDDLENKKKSIDSPRFTMDGKELYVRVYPEDDDENAGESICVYLFNNSKESESFTVSFKSSSGGNYTFDKEPLPAGEGRGFMDFLSHSDYKKWARENEDIFSLEVKVTLHVKNPSTWTTER